MMALAHGVAFAWVNWITLSEQIITCASKNICYKAACTISGISQKICLSRSKPCKCLYSRQSLEENLLFHIKCGRGQIHSRKWAVYFHFPLLEKKQKQNTACTECKLTVWRKLRNDLVEKAAFGGTFPSFHLFPCKNPDNNNFQASYSPFCASKYLSHW